MFNDLMCTCVWWRKCRVYLRCCRKTQSSTYWSWTEWKQQLYIS